MNLLVALNGVAFCLVLMLLLCARAAATIACDDSTDQASNINSAIAALGTTGGTVALPSGVCLIDSAIQIENNNIFLVGQGGGISGVANATAKGTQLMWNGATNGNTMLYFDHWNGSVYVQMQGGGLENISLAATNPNNTSCSGAPCVAGQGIQPFGLAGGYFLNVSFTGGFSYAGLDLPPISGLNTMHNTFVNISSDNETTNGGWGIRVGDGTVGNNNYSAYYNLFQNVFISYNDGGAIYFGASDSNLFEDVHAIAYNSSSTGIAMEFDCLAVSDHVDFFSPNGPTTGDTILVKGYGSGICSNTAGLAAQNDSIRLYSEINGGASPVLDGTMVHWNCETDTWGPC